MTSGAFAVVVASWASGTRKVNWSIIWNTATGKLCREDAIMSQSRIRQVSLQVIVLSCATFAQINHQNSTLIVNGHTGEAPTVQIEGRTYVDLESIAHITNGSLQIQGSHIVLQIPPPSLSGAPVGALPEPEKQSPAGLSREFTKSGIETIASLREWGSTLAYAIQNGYGVTERWIADYREQAANNLRLASSVASTESDRNALQLLTHEFDAVKDWSDKLVEAKNKMDVGKYATSPNALRDEPSSQKIIRCGHFLASMLGSGAFQDDPSCH
jgi:hypothetical protein